MAAVYETSVRGSHDTASRFIDRLAFFISLNFSSHFTSLQLAQRSKCRKGNLVCLVVSAVAAFFKSVRIFVSVLSAPSVVFYACLCVHVSTSVCALFFFFFVGSGFRRNPVIPPAALFRNVFFFLPFRGCGKTVRSICLFVLSIYWEFLDPPPSKKG